MMKGSIGLIVVLCLSCSSSMSIWEEGKEYHFVEESAVHVGTNDLDSSASGMRMMSDVRIQVAGNKLVVSIDNMQEAHYCHSYPRGGWPYKLVQEEDKDLKCKYIPSVGYEKGNTFSIMLEDGLVSNIELPEGLSMSGKNMMRALASILQMDTVGHDMEMWTRNERSIHGECAVEYAFVKGDQSEIMEMSKTVSHLKDCVKRNFKMFDNSDGYSCNGATMHTMGQSVSDKQHNDERHKMYHPEPIHSTSMTTFQMKNLAPQMFKVEKIFSAGAVVIQRFTEQGPTQVTLANRTLTLLEVKDMEALRPVQNPKTYNDLEFEWMEGKTVWNAPMGVDELKKKESFFYNGYTMDESQEDIMEAIKARIVKHVEEMNHFHDPSMHKDEAIQKLHEHGIQKLLPFFHGLNYDTLMKLKSFYFGLMTDNVMDKSARDVFLEMLPVTGTWPAALVVQEIVMNNDLKSDIETARIMTSIPFHVEPVKVLVEEFFKLILEASSKPHLQYPFTKSAIDLSYAHLVRKTCHELTTQQECFKALHVEEFINKFDALAVDDHAQLQHFMLVFYNLRDSEILEHKLTDIVLNKAPKTYDSALRTQAIFALASRTMRKGTEKDLFLPLFLNRMESHEVRIAAFDILIRGTPTTKTFNTIMTYMIYETDYEVFNYVYTAFEKFATHNNEPCGHILHDYAKYFIKYWKQHMWQKPKYTIGVSKRFSGSFTQEKYGYSGSVEVHTIGSHKATTPQSIMVDMRSQRYHHVTMQDFGMFIRMEGVAEKVVEKIREFVFNGKFEFEKLKEVLFTDMNIRQRSTVPARLDIVALMRDNVVFEYHLQDTEITGILGKLKEYMNQVKNMQDVLKFNRHFGFAWDMFVYEQPTDFGVPMAYASGATSVLGLVGEVKKNSGLKGEVDFRMHLNTDNTDMMTVFHPDQKMRFTIQQDRTYKHQLKSAVTAVLDTTTRKLMVTMKVPEAETPFSMLGHSQTFIYTSNNKIVGSQDYLKKSCPTCMMKQVVSHGEESRKNTNLLKSEYHELGHIYGLEVAGRLFDCEIPEMMSSGRQLFTLLKSFSPMSKEPKVLMNILFSGIRQVHAFFFYFPRIESCGANFMISQSRMDPVEEIIFELDLMKFQYMDNSKKIMNGKKIAVVGNIVFSGLVKRTHHIEMDLVVAPMWTKSNLDLEIKRMPFMLQSKNYPEFPIVFHMKNRYFGIDRPFLFKDLTSVDRHRIQSTMELTWGRPDLKITIEGDHKTTAEGINHLHSKWYYNTCVKEHSLAEWRKSEVLPTTDACLYALHDLLTLRHYTWDITATNLEPWMVTVYKKMGALMKTSMFPFWEYTPEYTSHEVSPRQPNIHIEQVFHTEEDTFDLTLKVDNDVSKFPGVNYGLWQWNTEPYQSLSQLTFFTRAMLQPELITYMYYNNIINHCHATSHSVRTYDNVTYPYTMDHSCWTLISSDCYEHPSFAVFIKKEEKAPLGMMALIGDQKIEFIPMEANKIHIKMNDKDYDLTDNGVIFSPLDTTPVTNKVVHKFKFKIIRRKTSYVLDFFPQMMINYDGNSVQVLAGPHVKGQNCGMCGDFNRNTHHELLDPQMCPLKNGDEMARAWTMDSKYCPTKITKPACTAPLV